MGNLKTKYNQATDNELAAALRQNLFVFAAFKNHHNIADIAAQLLDERGQLRSWPDFRDRAMAISADYNSHFLRVERDTALASAQMAVRWRDMENTAGALPFLKYVTVGDARVRRAHALLDGTTRRMDDAFWDEWCPPNGYNCRCDVQQVADGETPLPQTLPDEKQVPPAFRNNPGKTGTVFTLQHPYFNLVKPEQRAAILKATAGLIFQNYTEKQFFKDTVAAATRFRAAAAIPNAIGQDSATGGFIVLHKNHSVTGLRDELPVLLILRNRGAMLELLDEETRSPRYDLFWDGHFWDIKRLRNAARPDRAIRDHFRSAAKGGRTKLLIHIDQDITDAALTEALYQALRQQKEIQLVELVWNGGRTKRLTATQIRTKQWN